MFGSEWNGPRLTVFGMPLGTSTGWILVMKTVQEWLNTCG